MFFGTWFCLDVTDRKRGTEPHTTLRMALSIIVQVSNVQLILYHGTMALSHQIFTFFFFLFGLAVNFSPNYVWFAGRRGQRQRPLTEEEEPMGAISVRPPTSLLFHCLSQRRWLVCLWRPSRLGREEDTRCSLLHQIHFNQLIFWIYFPVDPRVELQTLRNCYLRKSAKLYGEKKKVDVYTL